MKNPLLSRRNESLVVGISPTDSVKITTIETKDELIISLKGVYSVTVSGEVFRFIDDNISIPRSSLTDGFHFIYYIIENNRCLLKHSILAWSISADKAPVCHFYWNTQANPNLLNIGYELHTTAMTWLEHSRIHYNEGTQYGYGLDLKVIDDEKITISDGKIIDEDIDIEIKNSQSPMNIFEQQLYPIARIPIYYRFGYFGFWRKLKETDYPFSNIVSNTVTSNIHTTNGWTLKECPDNTYSVYYIFATNLQYEPIVSIMAQDYSKNIDEVRNHNIDYTSRMNLFSQEFKLLYKLIICSNRNFNTVTRGQIVEVIDARNL